MASNATTPAREDFRDTQPPSGVESVDILARPTTRSKFRPFFEEVLLQLQDGVIGGTQGLPLGGEDLP